jgi:hypothetical protein
MNIFARFFHWLFTNSISLAIEAEVKKDPQLVVAILKTAGKSADPSDTATIVNAVIDLLKQRGWDGKLDTFLPIFKLVFAARKCSK